ncbi:TonB-dependent receptor domain-containing protein [Bacteroidota bacterium]
MKLAQLLPTVLLLVLLPLSLLSQSRHSGVVTGRILDAHTQQPVEYANILLIDTVSGKMVSGIVSDSNGMFRLEKIPVGTFTLEYSFIGYGKSRKNGVTISRKAPTAELGDLILDPSALTMNEVTVTAEKTMMVTKIDRKVFNVQKDIMAQTGTVTDMLQTIPSVTVDIDGNISLRGSGVTILINGRPSVMTGSANLEQMPASLIERIEVITNPSAKFKPDGTGGIINIILKKERKRGFNGILGANAGSNSRFNTNLQLNYNSGKINLFGSYGYRQDYRLRTRDLNSQTIDTATSQSTYLEQQGEGTSWTGSHLAQLGFDWNISQKDIVGIAGTYNLRTSNRGDSTWNQYSDSAKIVTEEFNRVLDGRETEESAGLNAYYEHVFNLEAEHMLRMDFEYQQEAEKENDMWTTRYDFPIYPEGKDHSVADNRKKEMDLTIGYSRPLWQDAALEVGYEGTVEIESQDQTVTSFDSASQQWILDPDQGSRFYGNQTVHALYTTVRWEWKKFRVLGGLRAEETLLDLEFRSIDTTAKSDYFALYPTIHMGIVSGKNEWQLNYSRRINRPDVDDMNPVPEYRDPRNIRVGNPDLKPEDIHSIEFGYSLQEKHLTLVPSLFYRYKVNGFTRVTTSLNDTTLITTMENLSTDQSAGIDLSGSWLIEKVANINFSASGFYNQIDASDIGFSSNKAAFSFNAKVNASFYITKTTLFQLNANFRSKRLTPQGYRQPTWTLNLGFRQDFWKKRISLIATVSDLFNSRSYKNHIDTPVLVQDAVYRRDARVFYAGFVFNFGTNGKKTKAPRFEFDDGAVE